MIIKIILIITLFFLHKTAQKPDRLLFKGQEYNLFTNPLEPYFEKYPDKRPDNKTYQSSTLWRGYIATFKITEDSLFIVKYILVKKWNKEQGIVEASVLNNIFNDSKVIVKWFSGLLVIPEGKMIKSVLMGYASEYEKYKIFHIDSGIYKSVREYEHAEYIAFKKRQFESFKKTKNYLKQFDNLNKILLNSAFLA